MRVDSDQSRLRQRAPRGGYVMCDARGAKMTDASKYSSLSDPFLYSHGHCKMTLNDNDEH